MLYERWRQVARAQCQELALEDAARQQRWTFGQLFAAGEEFALAGEGLVHPQGHAATFIFQVLAAWREGRVLCPLEPGQAPLDIPLPPAGCVHLKTTSASTGKPRLVAFRAGQLAADAENIVASMGLRPQWPNLGVISLAHSYGFSNLVLPLLLHGIPLLLAPSPLPEILRRAAQSRTEITLAAVPALWRAWLEARAIPPNARLAISAGAPLPAALEQEVFSQTGVKIHNFYGSSECGGIAYDTADQPRREDAFVGTALRNVSLSLEDSGCLLVESRAVGETYWPEPSPALAGGVFRTADLAEIIEGGIYLRGRASDLINVAGRKVAPESIERVLSQHPEVRECLVFGAPIPDADRTELIVAVVVPRKAPAVEDWRNFLLERLPAWQMPREWWPVESLQVTPRGKLSRAAWREKWSVERKERRERCRKG
jgi:acyl-CoA synthetase (AMP-forming)/AMP-acid ligase II